MLGLIGLSTASIIELLLHHLRGTPSRHPSFTADVALAAVDGRSLWHQFKNVITTTKSPERGLLAS